MTNNSSEKKQKTALRRTWLWQIVQFGLLAAFIALIYRNELSILSMIRSSEQSFGSVPLIHNILSSLPSYYILGQNWLLVWPFFLVSLSLLLLKSWRLRWYFLGCTGFFTSLLLLADLIYYNFFSALITVSSFKGIHQLWDVRSSIIASFPTQNAMLMCGPFVLFVLAGEILQRYVAVYFYQKKSSFIFDKTLAVIFFFLALNSYNIAFFFEKHNVEWTLDKNNQRAIIVHDLDEKNPQHSGRQQFSPPYDSSATYWAVSFGIINFHLKNLVTELLAPSGTVRLTAAQQSQLSSWLRNKEKLNQTASPFAGIAAKRNIVVISIESFHPFLLNFAIQGEEVTPTLNSLLTQGLSWNHILDLNYSGGSSDSEFALMSGLRPSRQKVSSLDLPQKIKLFGMPQLLQQQGYTTSSMHGYYPAMWNRSINHPRFGIQKMYFMDTFKAAKKLGMGIADKDFFRKIAGYIQKQQKPFFTYLISLSTHFPYQDIPDQYIKLFTNSGLEKNHQMLHYLQMYRYTDDALGIFFQTMKDNGLWDNTLFVLYGDHVPPLNEQAKKYLAEKCHVSFTNFKDNIVPLLILIPGEESLIAQTGDRYTAAVGSHHDIAPTIFHLLGIKIPAGWSGTHLFVPESQRDPVPINSTVFVTDGIIFHGPSQKIVTPNFEQAELFLEQGNLPSGNKVRNAYIKALQDMLNHRLLFDSDALKVLGKDAE